MPDSIARSSGHLEFEGRWEFYAVGDEVYRADVQAPVMPDGRRGGRWFCPMWQWKKRDTFPTAITAHYRDGG
jgi:hypothetical protein